MPCPEFLAPQHGRSCLLGRVVLVGVRSRPVPWHVFPKKTHDKGWGVAPPPRPPLVPSPPPPPPEFFAQKSLKNLCRAANLLVPNHQPIWRAPLKEGWPHIFWGPMLLEKKILFPFYELIFLIDPLIPPYKFVVSSTLKIKPLFFLINRFKILKKYKLMYTFLP